MGSRPERGAYGNARGVPDKQAKRRRLRENSPRHQAAAEEARLNQERLDQIAAENAKRAEAMGLTHRPEIKVEVLEKVAAGSAPAPEAKPEPVAGHRFAACHCSHAGHPDEKCRLCACNLYRPVTAPDPHKRAKFIGEEIPDLILRGKNSEGEDPRRLANRIEELLVQLKAALLIEERREAEERAREAAREKVRARMAELQAEMDRLQLELGDKGMGPRPAKPAVKRAPARRSEEYEYTEDGKIICPECREPQGSPAGLGRHRSAKHGVPGRTRK